MSTTPAGPRIDYLIGSPCLVPVGDLKPIVWARQLRLAVLLWRSSPDNLDRWPISAVGTFLWMRLAHGALRAS